MDLAGYSVGRTSSPTTGNAQREDRATRWRLCQRSSVRQRIQALQVLGGIATLWAAFLAARASPAQAAINVWTSHGPEESAINALILDPITPTTVYAAPYDGVVYKSMDGGHSWKAIGAPNYVGKLAIDPTPPSTIYAVTNAWGEPGSIFKSPDGGDTWQFAGLSCAIGEPSAFVIDPAAPTTLYLGLWPQCEGDGCIGGGLCKSTDGGATWRLLDTRAVVAILAAPAAPTSLYLSLGEDVVKSVDGGESWMQANTGLLGANVTGFAIDLAAPTTIYAASVGNILYGVYESTDGGATWSESSGRLNQRVYTLAIDPLAPRTVYAGTDGGGVFKSTDGGHTWNALNIGLTSLQVFTLAIDPMTRGRVYAGTYSGVFAIQQAAVVGNGTPESCTEVALDAALAEGGLVTFNCGPSPITITVTQPKIISLDTTVDGGGLITLDGRHAVGVFWVRETAALSVEGLTIANGGGGVLVGGAIFTNGTLAVTNSTFTGNSADSGGAIFNGPEPGTVTTSTFTNPGTVTVTNSTFINNSAKYDGGAIVNDGTLTVTNCTFTGNSASSRIFGSHRVGGAIATWGGSTLTVTNSTFSHNRATVAGGGIWSGGSDITVSNSVFTANATATGGAIAGVPGAGGVPTNFITVTDGTFTQNSATEDGGAIANGSILTVTDSTFAGNSAIGGGGAIANEDFSTSTATVASSTFSDNSATGGGAIVNRSPETGSGDFGKLTVTNSTFTDNRATGGGGIKNYGALTATNCTFSDNTAPTGRGGAIDNAATCAATADAPCPATLINTIVANRMQGANCGGTITDGGHNLDSDGTCGVGLATDPLLAPGLANNGGPTQTIALEAGSPAINAGEESACAAPPVNNLDQRGYVRPGVSYTNCSIGAFEYNSPSEPPTATPPATLTPTTTPSVNATPTVTPTTTPTPCTPLPPPMLNFSLSVEPVRPVVGNPVLFSFTVSGNGGLPQYTLSGAEPILQGDTSPVGTNQLGTVTYHLVAARAGTATLVLGVNYEAAVGCAEHPIFQFVNATSPPFSVTVVCPGNCNGDGAVTIDELITMVNIALGIADVSNCMTGDLNQDGQIAVSEIITAVKSALSGC